MTSYLKSNIPVLNVDGDIALLRSHEHENAKACSRGKPIY